MAIHKDIKLDYERILNPYCMEYDIRFQLVEKEQLANAL